MDNYLDYSFRTSNINILLHIPNKQNNYAKLVLDSIVDIIQTVKNSVLLIEDQWNLTLESDSNQSTLIIHDGYTQTDKDRLQNKIEKACYFSVDSLFQVNQKKKKRIRFFATLFKSRYFTMPMIDDEKVIEISIPKDIFSKVNYIELKQTIQQICLRLDVTYACLDINILCPRSIYLDGFFFFSDMPAELLNCETHIPGIHWAQFITPNMIKNTGSLPMIYENAPCHYSELIYKNTEIKGIWIELSKNYWDINIDERIKMRTYLSSSLYKLSYEKIKQYKSPYKQAEIDFLPLYSCEREFFQIP